MKQLNVDEIKKTQLKILSRVAKYCEENNIIYSLAYGTLIGAIRHKGYIPWDDDIDIVMPRPDYDQFINNFNGTTENLKVYATELDHKFLYTFAKVSDERTLLVEHSSLKYNIGVNIDVFAIDGISVDDKYTMRKQYFNKALLDIKIIKLDSRRNLLKNFILLVGKVALFWLSIERINSVMIKRAKKYSFYEEKYCCNIATGFKEDKVLPSKYFKRFSECTFENEKFMTTEFYYEWLTSIYGDYMQLPPIDKQVSHHDFTAYLK